MRLQHDVVHREQRFRHVRLVGENIEAGAAEAAFLERRHQRRLVDHRAARDVDEDALRAERVEDARSISFSVAGPPGTMTISAALSRASSTRSG